MAAVYASLVSLIHVINHTQNPPLPYAFLQKLQTQPLLNQVRILLQFVENSSHHTRRTQEFELLQSRIAAAAYEAEGIIKTFVVDQILIRKSAESSTTSDEDYSISCESLEEVVQEMDLIIEEVLKIEANHEESYASSAPPPPPPSGGKKNPMVVGLDDDLIILKEKLSTNQRDRVVLPITGMGGIGKTTLARNIYDDSFIKSHFVIQAWATVSQDYSLRKVILSLLNDQTDTTPGESDQELGLELHKKLYGQKYLIVLDDMWSITAWNAISTFLPDNSKGSRILLTTRLSDLAVSLVGSSNTYKMKFLDDNVSWNLLSETIYGGRVENVIQPPELEECGKKIARSCKGLPLAIVVIGGILKVSVKTSEYWSEVAENVSSIVNNESDEQCLKILSLSYNWLPIQLKPLFLYMAIFPEDSIVKVSKLIKLWVSEGFLKPPPLNDINKTLEDVAKDHFEDLINRNLIMVNGRSRRGNIKTCKIHDLLRDLCLREAKRERFHCVEKMYDKYIVTKDYIISSSERRFDMHSRILSNSRIMSSLARTVVMFSNGIIHALEAIMEKASTLRYLDFMMDYEQLISVHRYISFPWNLETLIIEAMVEKDFTISSDMWDMKHLRHLKFSTGVKLPTPDSSKPYCILNNLQTLCGVRDFMLTNEILGRIPNLKKLSFYNDEIDKEPSFYNLVLLRKLEILECDFYSETEISLNFPSTLRKLSLSGSMIPWENMSIIGSLPNLEVLELGINSFCGSIWSSNEGEFQCLEILKVYGCEGWQVWNADSSSFPVLKSLSLRTEELKEIPWGIGEIPSLESITLYMCNKSVILSANEIQLEVQEQGNDDLFIHVEIDEPDDEIQILATHNFQVETFLDGMSVDEIVRICEDISEIEFERI